jgi:nitric oxide reductase NorQ protein
MCQAHALKIEEYHVESAPYYEPVGKEIELFEAGPDFCMAISYNPGHQSVPKDLKQSTRQRFVVLEFDYPSEATEQEIVAKEAGIDAEMEAKFVKFAGMARNLKGSGLEESASSRLLGHTGKLIASGIDPVTACRGAISEALTGDAEMLVAVNELSRSVF